jgi:hypothetical protein
MPFLGKQPTSGFSTIVKDDFTPDGSTTAFTLSKNVASANDIAVFVGNVRQEPTDAYSVNGTTLTMTAAPSSGVNFYVLHIAGTHESSVIPADDTISTAKIQNDAITSAKMDTNIALDGTLTLNGATPQTTYAIQTADKSVYLSSTDATYSNVTIRKGSATTTDYIQIRNDANTLMYKVDSNGYVSKLYQPYFYAKNTGAGSENGDGVTTTTIIFPTSTKDVGGNLSNTGSRFTAPVDGLYFFTGVPGYKQSSADFAVRLALNGTQITDVVRLIGSGVNSHSGVSFGANIFLNANDYIELISVGGAYHRNNASVPNWWSGGLLWAT